MLVAQSKKCAVLTPCNTPVHASADLFTIPLPSAAEHAQQTLVAVVPARGTNCMDAEIALCIEFVSPHDLLSIELGVTYVPGENAPSSLRLW